jgi:indolepyruvate ferredoxin oxidoreductase beta subunit
VTAALASQPYRAGDVVAALANSLQAEAPREQAAAAADAAEEAAASLDAADRAAGAKDTQAPGVDGYPVPLFIPVDDEALVAHLGAGSRKSLNMMLLAVAVAQGRIPLTVAELKAAVQACVKPQFVVMNLEAIDHAADAYG